MKNSTAKNREYNNNYGWRYHCTEHWKWRSSNADLEFRTK